MRCTQTIGFGRNNPINQEELDNLYSKEYSKRGMFDEIPLMEYIFNESPIYREIVQYCLWSSGPMEHLAYERVSDGKLFSFWNENEVRL